MELSSFGSREAIWQTETRGKDTPSFSSESIQFSSNSRQGKGHKPKPSQSGPWVCIQATSRKVTPYSEGEKLRIERDLIADRRAYSEERILISPEVEVGQSTRVSLESQNEVYERTSSSFSTENSDMEMIQPAEHIPWLKVRLTATAAWPAESTQQLPLPSEYVPCVRCVIEEVQFPVVFHSIFGDAEQYDGANVKKSMTRHAHQLWRKLGGRKKSSHSQPRMLSEITIDHELAAAEPEQEQMLADASTEISRRMALEEELAKVKQELQSAKSELAEKNREVAEAHKIVAKAGLDWAMEKQARDRVHEICMQLSNALTLTRAELALTKECLEEVEREMEAAKEERDQVLIDVHKERENLAMAVAWREHNVHLKLVDCQAEFDWKFQLLKELQAHLETSLVNSMAACNAGNGSGSMSSCSNYGSNAFRGGSRGGESGKSKDGEVMGRILSYLGTPEGKAEFLKPPPLGMILEREKNAGMQKGAEHQRVVAAAEAVGDMDGGGKRRHLRKSRSCSAGSLRPPQEHTELDLPDWGLRVRSSSTEQQILTQQPAGCWRGGPTRNRHMSFDAYGNHVHGEAEPPVDKSSKLAPRHHRAASLGTAEEWEWQMAIVEPFGNDSNPSGGPGAENVVRQSKSGEFPPGASADHKWWQRSVFRRY